MLAEIKAYRIIPTRVGTRLYCVHVQYNLQDHPHACGDKEKPTNTAEQTAGSSPRVWGQDGVRRATDRRRRIIPTRVGTRGIPTYKFTVLEDHPHACGDKAVRVVAYIIIVGSSPRVWGQGSVAFVGDVFTRIIPTRVGTSPFAVFKKGKLKDHPHACGDKVYQVVLKLRSIGSSPRVWGQVVFNANFHNPTGIIPTRVGTSFIDFLTSYLTQDHPHACGDKNSFVTCLLYSGGSSPRVWGQAFLSINGVSRFRIIPTRVGTSVNDGGSKHWY